jgi:hypothetical protein
MGDQWREIGGYFLVQVFGSGHRSHLVFGPLSIGEVDTAHTRYSCSDPEQVTPRYRVNVGILAFCRPNLSATAACGVITGAADTRVTVILAYSKMVSLIAWSNPTRATRETVTRETFVR